MRLEPDLAAVLLDHFARDGQTKAAPLVLVLTIESLERGKYALRIIRFDTHTVVFHRKAHEPVALGRSRHSHLGRHVEASKLDGIADQVEEELVEARAVAKYLRERVHLNLYL